jgi:serine/threonine protein kinase
MLRHLTTVYFSTTTTTTTTTTTIRHEEVEKNVPYRLPLRFSTHDVGDDWDIDLSNGGLVGAGAFAEVRHARPAVPITSSSSSPSSPPVVVKSFHQDTDIYFDSLNRELAALDAVDHVPGVHNYLMTYGDTFASLLPADDVRHAITSEETSEETTTSSTSGGELHIVSTFIPHGDLFDYIMNQPNGQVEELNALNIGKQLCEALHGVHEAGWIHLDVKPENVCILGLGDGEEELEGEEEKESRRTFASVRLIDFGHARPFPNGVTKIIGEAGSDSYAAVSFFSFFFYYL